MPEGIDILRRIGVTWFVSYSYHNEIDSNHINWKRVCHETRVADYNRTPEYHEDWLRYIIDMNANVLSANRLGLSGDEVVEMAREILERKRN